MSRRVTIMCKRLVQFGHWMKSATMCSSILIAHKNYVIVHNIQVYIFRKSQCNPNKTQWNPIRETNIEVY